MRDRRAAPATKYLAAVLLPALAAAGVLFQPRPSAAHRDHAGAAQVEAAPGAARRTLVPEADVALAGTLLRFAAKAGRELDGRSPGTAAAEKDLDRLAERARAALGDERAPRGIVSALNRLLFEHERFSYDPEAGNPDNFLLDRVLARRRGNCLGIASVYMALAERLGLPLRAVYVPSHCFVRFDDPAGRINIEPGDRGGERGDERYAREFGVVAGRPYLASLGEREFLGVFLKSLGAAYSRRGMEERALETYRLAAQYYPELPDPWYNAGVSYQKLGRTDEAIARYRRALALDPGMIQARANLGTLLARKGLYREALEEARKAVAYAPRSAVSRGALASALCACGDVEGGIREFREAVALDPRNARALEGLAKAYYARGMYAEAADACRRAEDAGCRFDAAMLSVLEPYRAGRVSAGP